MFSTGVFKSRFSKRRQKESMSTRNFDYMIKKFAWFQVAAAE
jgi:hypothetical protein